MKTLMIVLQILVAFLVLIGVGAVVMLVRNGHHPASDTSHQRKNAISANDRIAIANAACGRPTSLDEHRSVTCSVCPSGSDFANPGSMPGTTGWTLGSIISGQFTTPGADEALVRINGCESHAQSFGGDFIMRRTRDVWTVIRYASGATADETCQKLPWAGRDALICESSDMHAGIASDAVQFLLFDATPSDDDFEDTSFIETTDESSNCGFEFDPDAKSRLIQLAKIDSVKILPPSKDGLNDVAVQATIARVKSPRHASEGCPTGHPHSYTVLFHNKGDHFEASDGYGALKALTHDDCCQLVVSEKVRPGKY